MLCGTDKESGVIVPHGVDINQEGYIDALKTAHDVFKYYYAFSYLDEFFSYEMPSVRHLTAQQNEQIVNRIEMIKEGFSKGILLDEREWFETICQSYFKEIDEHRQWLAKKATKVAKRIENAKGYVYLIEAETGQYKIGRSKNPPNRLRAIGVKMPFKVEIIHTIQTNDMYSLEINLHQRFADKRVNGEWFALSQDDVDYIKGLANENV